MAGRTSTTKLQSRERAACVVLYLLFGPIIWLLHFTAIYAVQSTLCTLALPMHADDRIDLVPLVIVVATVFVLAALAAAIWGLIPVLQGPRSEVLSANKFFHETTRLLCFLAAIGIMWGCFAALLIHPCASLR